MNALDDILKAEQEAATKLEAARMSASQALATAKAERAKLVQEQAEKLAADKAAELEDTKNSLVIKTVALKEKAESTAEAITATFNAKHDELKKFVVEKL